MWSAGLWKPAGVSFLLVVFCHLGWLGEAPMWATDGFRAITAHEMAESGDWLLPRKYDALYLRKPPGHYWILAALEWAVGVGNEWVWRLPSVITAGLTAGLCALMAGRWFGRVAAWAGGLGYITLAALWSQSRSADIDGNLTFFSVACAFCLLELGFGQPRRKWLWSVGAALTLAATILLKGHSGLIVVGGVLLGGSIAVRQWRWLVRPSCWVALLVGVAIPIAWGVAAYLQIERLGLELDLRGLREASHNVLKVDDPAQTGELDAVLTQIQDMTATQIALLVMAMPPALLVLFTIKRLWQRGGDMSRTLLGAVAASMAIVLVNGVTNPRYGYVLLPLWLPLSGKVAADWFEGRLPEVLGTVLRMIATGLCVGVFIAHAVFAVLLWGEPTRWMPAAATGVLSLAIGIVGVGLWVRQRVPAGSLAIVTLFALLIVPVAHFKNAQHVSSSGIDAARIIRRHVPEHATLICGDIVHGKPEILYYSDRDIDNRQDRLRDPDAVELPPGAWVVFTGLEWQIWREARGEQFIEKIDLNGRGWLVRHAPRRDGHDEP